MSDVIKSGPLFDGKAGDSIHRGIEELKDRMAEIARDKARDIQLARIRVEHSGAEPASLHVMVSDTNRMVTDNHAIVYGPWLEGTGSRNETTRFKGYHAMRIAADETQAEAGEKAEEILRPYIAEMNE